MESCGHPTPGTGPLQAIRTVDQNDVMSPLTTTTARAECLGVSVRCCCCCASHVEPFTSLFSHDSLSSHKHTLPAWRHTCPLSLDRLYTIPEQTLNAPCLVEDSKPCSRSTLVPIEWTVSTMRRRGTTVSTSQRPCCGPTRRTMVGHAASFSSTSASHNVPSVASIICRPERLGGVENSDPSPTAAEVHAFRNQVPVQKTSHMLETRSRYWLLHDRHD